MWCIGCAWRVHSMCIACVLRGCSARHSARHLRREDVLEKLLARLHLLHDVGRADRRALPVLRVSHQTVAAARRVSQPERVDDERPAGVGLQAESVGLQAWCVGLQPGCVGLQPATREAAARRPSAPAHEGDEGRVGIGRAVGPLVVFPFVSFFVGVARFPHVDGRQLRPPD